MMQQGIKFKQLSAAENLVQLRIDASNGVFTGSTAPYFDHDALWNFSRNLGTF